MNVQQLIIKGIREQLFLNNYLVIPGFGGFVLRHMPAHFSGAGSILLPPSKTISFNIQLKQNDGLLAIWLQAKLSCSAGEALKHLEEFAGFCKSILDTRRRLSLDTIGFFYLDFENNICFEPLQDSNFLAKSFGLAPVPVREKEIVPEPVVKKEPVFIDRPAVPERAINTPAVRRSYTRILVPAAIMILFLSGLLLFVSTSQINGQLQAALFSGNAKGVYKPLTYPTLPAPESRKDNEAYVADANGITMLSLGANKTIAVKVLNSVLNKPDVINLRPVSKAISTTGKFEIVLGCFTMPENANRLLAKVSANNVQAFVSGKNSKGMYVVSGGAFNTKEEAISGLAQLKGTYPKAWIKKPD